MTRGASIDSDYTSFIGGLKARVAAARLSAARAVNRELISLYWDIGKAIVNQQLKLGWGKSVVEQIARDLRTAFPGAQGFSARNVWDMRRLYDEYTRAEVLRQLVTEIPKVAPRQFSRKNSAEPAAELLRQLVAEVPWGHHLLILNKLDQPVQRLHYLRATVAFGWSRNVLLNQIKAKAFERSQVEGKSHNFPTALPEYLAEQAEEALKSSYNLEFLGIRRQVKERELEDRLIDKLRDFILELGYGFCFVGKQHRITLGRNEYFIDLLFYHRFLKALVAVELKVGKFEPDLYSEHRIDLCGFVRMRHADQIGRFLLVC